MKKQLSFNLLLLAGFIVSSISASAQEFIKSVNLTANSNSIIRCASTNSWLYCSERPEFGTTFSLINNSNNTHPVFQLPYYETGLTIKSNTAFFCGNDYNHHFGYFSLANFPNTDVRIVNIIGLKPVDNIEVFYYDALVRHVVLTGTYNNQPCIIDAMQTYPYYGDWTTTIATNTNLNITYHDIAVTNNYVVASGQISGSDTGYVVAFKKVQSALGGFLSGGRYIHTEKLAYGNIFLKEGGGDTVFIVYQSSVKGDKFVVEERRIAQNGNTTTIPCIKAKEYTGPVGNFKITSASIGDVTYKSTDNAINVLIRWNTNNSTVWSISHYDLITGGNITGRNFPGYHLQSLDAASNSSSNTLGSGKLLSNNAMKLFRTYAISGGECTTLYECVPTNITPYNNPDNYNIETTTITLAPLAVDKTITTVSTSTDCSASRDDE